MSKGPWLRLNRVRGRNDLAFFRRDLKLARAGSFLILLHHLLHRILTRVVYSLEYTTFTST